MYSIERDTRFRDPAVSFQPQALHALVGIKKRGNSLQNALIILQSRALKNFQKITRASHGPDIEMLTINIILYYITVYFTLLSTKFTFLDYNNKKNYYYIYYNKEISFFQNSYSCALIMWMEMMRIINRVLCNICLMNTDASY